MRARPRARSRAASCVAICCIRWLSVMSCGLLRTMDERRLPRERRRSGGRKDRGPSAVPPTPPGGTEGPSDSLALHSGRGPGADRAHRMRAARRADLRREPGLQGDGVGRHECVALCERSERVANASEARAGRASAAASMRATCVAETQHIHNNLVVPAKAATAVVPAKAATAVVPAKASTAVVPAKAATAVVPAKASTAVVPAKAGTQCLSATGKDAGSPPARG